MSILPRRLRSIPMAALAAALVMAPATGKGVFVIGPTDPGTGQPTGGPLTTAPGSGFPNNGWDYEGTWQGAFTGTPIAPNYFITSAHLGGSVGDTFVYQGTSYTTTAAFNDPASTDLEIWKVSGTFPSFAPLDTAGGEVGQSMYVYGRGGPPGASTANGQPINGFLWTAETGALSYGTNTVTGTTTLPGTTGPFLVFQFNSALGPTTGALTAGDSGGGVFILQNGVWTLAGINFATDGPYNTVPNSTTGEFNASLYDSRGLYFAGDSSPISGSNPVPSNSYSSQISSQIAWIDSITAVPEPGSFALLLAGLCLGLPLYLRAGGSWGQKGNREP